MHLKIVTKVSADWRTVKDGFTDELFLALNPPFPKVTLLRFDGSLEGDIVQLELNFLLFRQMWTSEIISDWEQADSFTFVDEGLRLPFFLKSWKHRHVIEAADDGSQIIDDICYSTGTLFTDLLMYPVLLLQFLYRKPVYAKYFSH